MTLNDIIAKLLGTKPTADTIATKLREAQDNRIKLVAEIEELDRSRQDMIGDPKAKERVRRRIAEARDEIEDIDVMIPGLEARYREAQAQAAARALAQHRAAMVAAFEVLDRAITAAHTANDEAVSTWEAARAELGEHVVRMNFPILYFGAPLSVETIARWRREVGAALVPVKAQPVTVPTQSAVAPVVKPVQSLQRTVRLGEIPQQPGAPVRREPRRETPRNGEVAVRVLRHGYETPRGVQCDVGDIVALPPEVAAVAAKNSAVDYCSGAAA